MRGRLFTGHNKSIYRIVAQTTVYGEAQSYMTRPGGKKKLIRDISANTLQTLVSQVFGLLIFYLTSRFLDKAEFGDLNWCSAVAATCIAIGSLGLDLVYVKRLAAGEQKWQLIGMHFFHSVVSSLLLAALAFAYVSLNQDFSFRHPLFLVVFLNLGLANVANTFKLCLNGLEAYRRLALVALVVNAMRLSLLVALWLSSSFDGFTVVCAYIASSAIELVLAYFLTARILGGRPFPQFMPTDYKKFIYQSLPQLGVVLFDSALARIDWILLGIISTTIITAEYSFSFKVYELSRFPLLIVAPLLLTRFSKLYAQGSAPDLKQEQNIMIYFNWLMAGLTAIPLVLACCWTPLVDGITSGKYGQVGEPVYLILAVCVPLTGMINFLWTIGFVRGRLKNIFYITFVSALVNITANVALIPLYQGRGAALAFLFSTMAQLVLYLLLVRSEGFLAGIFRAFIPVVIAILSVMTARLFIQGTILVTGSALLLYATCIFLFRFLRTGDLKIIFENQYQQK